MLRWRTSSPPRSSPINVKAGLACPPNVTQPRRLVQGSEEPNGGAVVRPGEVSRSLLLTAWQLPRGYHRLARWSLTLVAIHGSATTPGIPPACPVESHALCYYSRLGNNPGDTTGLSCGVSRSLLPTAWQLPPGIPPACPVESHARCYSRLGNNPGDAIPLRGGRHLGSVAANARYKAVPEQRAG